MNLIVRLPNGRKIIGNREIKDCPIQVDGHEWLSNLIVVDVPKYDLILGTDWMD